MSELAKYSNEKYSLTEREQEFIKHFLSENGCGAQTPEVLLGDNFSCQCVEDLRDTMNLTANQVGGFLASLQEKQVIWCEDERGDDIVITKNGPKRVPLPDLYWVDDNYLESLDPDLDFYAEV